MKDDGGAGAPRLLLDKAQDQRLHRHVERGRRFVGDDELGLAGEGHGNQHALPHAPESSNGIGLHDPLRLADQHVAQQSRGLAGGSGLVETLVAADDLDHLARRYAGSG